MKNTLTVNVDGGFRVECLDSVYDESNSLFLSVIVGDSTMPRIELKNGSESSSFNLTSNSENVVEILNEFIKPGSIVATYRDGEEKTYAITFAVPEETKGNMMIRQSDTLTYDIVFAKKDWDGKKLPIATKEDLGCIIAGDGIGVRQDGTAFVDGPSVVDSISNASIDSICV